jgi:hypothetical protein
VGRLPFRRLDQETVIVDPRNRQIHVLNGTGSAIWALLEKGRTIPDLVSALTGDEGGGAAGFDGDSLVIARDVETFIADLAGRGLVVDVTPPGGAG